MGADQKQYKLFIVIDPEMPPDQQSVDKLGKLLKLNDKKLEKVLQSRRVLIKKTDSLTELARYKKVIEGIGFSVKLTQSKNAHKQEQEQEQEKIMADDSKSSARRKLPSIESINEQKNRFLKRIKSKEIESKTSTLLENTKEIIFPIISQITNQPRKIKISFISVLSSAIVAIFVGSFFNGDNPEANREQTSFQTAASGNMDSEVVDSRNRIFDGETNPPVEKNIEDLEELYLDWDSPFTTVFTDLFSLSRTLYISIIHDRHSISLNLSERTIDVELFGDLLKISRLRFNLDELGSLTEREIYEMTHRKNLAAALLAGESPNTEKIVSETVYEALESQYSTPSKFNLSRIRSLSEIKFSQQNENSLKEEFNKFLLGADSLVRLIRLYSEVYGSFTDDRVSNYFAAQKKLGSLGNGIFFPARRNSNTGYKIADFGLLRLVTDEVLFLGKPYYFGVDFYPQKSVGNEDASNIVEIAGDIYYNLKFHDTTLLPANEYSEEHKLILEGYWDEYSKSYLSEFRNSLLEMFSSNRNLVNQGEVSVWETVVKNHYNSVIDIETSHIIEQIFNEPSIRQAIQNMIINSDGSTSWLDRKARAITRTCPQCKLEIEQNKPERGPASGNASDAGEHYVREITYDI